MSDGTDGRGRPGPGIDAASPGSDAERHQVALAHLKEILVAHGTTEQEVDQAVADGMVDLFAADRTLIPAPRRYSRAEVAERTGVPPELVDRFFRALGFPSFAEGESTFTDLDVQALQVFRELQDQGREALGVIDTDTALQMLRILGSSMARVADSEIGAGGGVGDWTDPVLRAEAVARISDTMIPRMAKLLEYVWRRQIVAAIQRNMLLRSHGIAAGQSPLLAVGFADMVGFTLLSQHLSEGELAAVVRRFEQISHDIVTGRGGRVVKMIGDEVMFVAGRADQAARIGLELADAYADDDLLSDVRVGLASGPVLLHDGDYFGSTVNLAHRIVNIANPGTVLMSDEFHALLMEEAPDEFAAQPLRPRLLKDLGRVQLWSCQPSDGRGVSHGEPMGGDRRNNVRWERLGEVLRDLEELREARQSVLTGPTGTETSGESAAAQPGRGDAEGA